MCHLLPAGTVLFLYHHYHSLLQYFSTLNSVQPVVIVMCGVCCGRCCRRCRRCYSLGVHGVHGSDHCCEPLVLSSVPLPPFACLPLPDYLVDIFSMFFSSVAFHSLCLFLPLLFSAAEEVLTVVVLWWWWWRWYSLLSYLLIY